MRFHFQHWTSPPLDPFRLYATKDRLGTGTWFMRLSLRQAFFLFQGCFGVHAFPVLQASSWNLAWSILTFCYSSIQVHLCFSTTGTTGATLSTPSIFTEKYQQMNKLDKLRLQIRMMTYEKDVLCLILDLYNNYDLNNR